jgi:3-deoxy-D-manno-octulosonic-acid transferase
LCVIFCKKKFSDRVNFRNHHINDCIWIHAASIGEVNAVKPLVKRLLEKYKNKTFVMTCTSRTGVVSAREISGKLIVYQFPLDVPHLMKRFIKLVNPRLILIVETELWPNMLYQVYRKNIPAIVLNGRLSQKSFKRFKFFRWFLQKQFAAVKLVCAQAEKDELLFNQLKFQNVINANNLKFAISLPNHETHVVRHAWRFSFNDFIIAFGCSRPGEEILIKKVHEKLAPIIPRLKIIIAPRHLERLPDVKAMFNKGEYSMFSSSSSTSGQPFLIVDEIGVLPQMYALSDIAIIGGSFYKFGGHSPLEAVWYEKPVIIGEHHLSCVGTIEKLQSSEAIVVSTEAKLYDDILALYENIEYRKELGVRAKQVLIDNQDAIEQHWEAIIKWV